jgi:hypothetical protein
VRRRQLVSADEAVRATSQHTRPCSDCPWRRDALPGWLGSMTADEWTAAVHGEASVECHTLLGAQCAGAAIYRANICKLPRDPRQLRLPKDRAAVFGRPGEFISHHERGGRR